MLETILGYLGKSLQAIILLFVYLSGKKLAHDEDEKDKLEAQNKQLTQMDIDQGKVRAKYAKLKTEIPNSWGIAPNGVQHKASSVRKARKT